MFANRWKRQEIIFEKYIKNLYTEIVTSPFAKYNYYTRNNLFKMLWKVFIFDGLKIK